MTLSPGQTLSQYRLVEQIGEGGMGVVWKALDTSLEREVAIKVLPETFAADPDRLARFEREAKLLASLNHPNIATIHGLHEQDGVRFLAMELVSGMDLSQHLAQGPIVMDEALEVGLQVAAALEAAHENGVIHRDLKPANIQVGADGKIKVLDFGLAKAFEPEPAVGSGSISPTLTTPATRAGVILGTAAYMSPEQAKGKAVDRRADIWSFGCVLYEMLVGERPFQGDGVTEVMAAVIMGPVDLKKIPSGVPAGIRKLLHRSLEKDPRRRLRDIGEARFTIEETLSGAVEETEPSTAAKDPGRSKRGWLAWASGLILAAAVGAFSLWVVMPGAEPTPLRRFEIPAAGPYQSVSQGNLLSISPDGSRVAYAEEGRLFIRKLDRLEVEEVTTPGDPAFLFWSPDSAWLGFGAANKLMKAPADGGESQVISDQPGTLSGGSGASWGPNGKIVLARGDEGIYHLSERGGDLETVLQADGEVVSDYHEPAYLPDGNGFLFVLHRSGGRPDTLLLYAKGEQKELLKIDGQDIWHPSYAASGHILFRRQPTNPGIWALPFSLAKHEVTGEAFLVVPEGDVPTASNDGTLVHVRGAANRITQMVSVDRKGNVVQEIGQPQEQWPFFQLSPDGTQVAISATENELQDIWIHDVERGTKTRLTFGPENSHTPNWSPDGKKLVYLRGTTPPFQMIMKSADGTGEERELGTGYDPSFSPDGRYLVSTDLKSSDGWDLYILDLQEGGERKKWLEASALQQWPRISPGGDYLAYISQETGRDEVYIKRFPSAEGKWQVSVDGGHWPIWNKKGDRLYYIDSETVMEVEVTTKPTLRLGRPREVFTREPLGWPLRFGWPPAFDVSADEQTFILCRAANRNQQAQSIVVVENWLREFDSAK